MRIDARLMSRMAAVALAVIVGAVIVSALDTPGTPGGNENPALAAAAPAPQAPSTEPAKDAAGPAEACRRAPECWTDADCDAICGTGLGKCIHSSCPVRICRCH